VQVVTVTVTPDGVVGHVVAQDADFVTVEIDGVSVEEQVEI